MPAKSTAIHPIKIGKTRIKPGAEIAPDTLSATRLQRLIDKGRVTDPNAAPANRADLKTGRDDLKLPAKAND